MLKIGRRKRYLTNAIGQAMRPKAGAPAPSSEPGAGVVRGYKARRGYVQDGDHQQSATLFESLIETTKPEVVTAATVKASMSSKDTKVLTAAGSSGGGGSSGGSGSGSSGGSAAATFGSSSAKVDRFNPVYDDLSRGTVAEDWIPRDPRLQNRMFRMMFARGQIEGPVVETISEMCWSDFDLGGIQDQKILDTYMAAKEAVRVDRYLEDITKEYLVIGRVVIQMILDPGQGIWTDMVIHDSDYLKITPIPRTGYMPKIDLIPSPDMQMWAKSLDPRDVEAKKGLPKSMLEQFMTNKPIPLDPSVTAYLPRRSFFNDVFGTSFYVRNIPLWGLEKSLINATLTGHRRRAGPITQIAVGSEMWEPTPEQIDALVSAYTAAEEDSVSSTIGTRYDVAFNQIRGGLQEMWKWQDEWAFLQEAKLKMFGVSEQLLTGDANIDTSTAPTIFLERLKAHRKYVTETFLMQKFFRALAVVHNFRKRSQAELSHRIRVDGDDHELILPTISFHKSLDQAADTARGDLLDKMEEKGIPVSMMEWNRSLGGGDLMERMRGAVEDLGFRLEAMKFQQLKQRTIALQEGAGDNENIDSDTKELQVEVKKLSFGKDTTGLDVAELSKRGKKRAEDMSEMDLGPNPNTGPRGGDVASSSADVIVPRDTRKIGTSEQDLAVDRSTRNRDPNSLSRVGKAI